MIKYVIGVPGVGSIVLILLEDYTGSMRQVGKKIIRFWILLFIHFPGVGVFFKNSLISHRHLFNFFYNFLADVPHCLCLLFSSSVGRNISNLSKSMWFIPILVLFMSSINELAGRWQTRTPEN